MGFLSPRLQTLGLLASLSLSSFVVTAGEVEVLAEVAKLLAPDGEAVDRFGVSVSLDGDRLAVGAYFDDDQGENSGSAYVFEREAEGSWRLASKLLALDGRAQDFFGHSVSLNGDRLAIGAARDDDNGSESGSAYIFEREAGGSWVQANKLLAPDGQAHSFFGESVSLFDDRLAVGAYVDDASGTDSGSVYIFAREAEGNWLPETKLVAPDGERRDRFGVSVSLDGERLAIGANMDDDNGVDSGSAYVFERGAGGNWNQATKLLGIDGQAFDFFGVSVSLDGERLAVGADSDDANGTDSGSVYVFERESDGGWIPVSKLLALDGQTGDNFGYTVSLGGDRLAVGANKDESETTSDSAYVFEREADGSWLPASTPFALDGEVLDKFGISVSLDGDRLSVGAYLDDDNGNASGSVYVFEPVLVSPHLTISGTCPGEVQLAGTGTTPRSRFGIYGSPNQGIGEAESGPCAGAVLGLDAPALLRLTDSDFDAEGTLVRTVSALWCGRYLQLLDERTCLTSNVVQIP